MIFLSSSLQSLQQYLHLDTCIKSFGFPFLMKCNFPPLNFFKSFWRVLYMDKILALTWQVQSICKIG